MATGVTFNGVSYSVPAVNEEDWQSLSNYLIALQNAAVSGGPVSSAVRVSALATTAVATSDYAVLINYTSGAATVNLPAGVAGQVFYISDASGTAATNNITINPDGANTILGGASLVVDRNSEVIGLIFSGGNWYRIGQSFPDAVSVAGTVTPFGLAAFLDSDGDYLADLGVGTANQVLVTDGTAPFFSQIVNANVASGAAIDYTKLNLSSSIVNSDISGSAAIEYTKLALTGQIVNADINASAAIAYSKLDLANSVQNTDIAAAANIAYSKLDLTGQLVNADVSASAAIAYSKLDLTDSVVNADINSAAAIAYSKLDLTGSVVDADINASAAIARSKIAAGTASHVVVNDGAGALSSVAVLPVSQGGTGLSALGSALQVLRVDSLGTSLEFATLAAGSGDVIGPASSVTNGIVQFASTTGKALKDLGVGSPNQVLLTDGTAPSFGAIINDYIDASAAIAYSKLATLTASRALESSGTGVIQVSAVTSTELGYVSGVTSAIQTQIDGKEPTISLTINRAVISDGTGGLDVSATTSTELGYVSGVTSAIQTQIDGKVSDTGDTMTGALTINTASNQIVLSSGVNQLTLNSGTSAAARTYTVPDVGTSADFVMTAGAQTIAGAKTFSDEISTDATHLGGYGLLPVGAIVAYNPGYYTSGNNGSFQISGPAGNSRTQVNAFLNSKGWYVCNGDPVNVAASPIWNAAGRHLPNLDDGRFLRGSTTAGTQGGSNSITLTAGNIPSLTSSGSVTTTGSTVANTTGNESSHTHGVGSYRSNASLSNNTGYSKDTHFHELRTGTFSPDRRLVIQAVSAGGNNKLVQTNNNPSSDRNSITNSPGGGSTITLNNSLITGTSGTGSSHNHSIPSLTVNSGQSVSVTYTNGTPTAISILPQYLNTFYIVRVF